MRGVIDGDRPTGSSDVQTVSAVNMRKEDCIHPSPIVPYVATPIIIADIVRTSHAMDMALASSVELRKNKGRVPCLEGIGKSNLTVRRDVVLWWSIAA